MNLTQTPTPRRRAFSPRATIVLMTLVACLLAVLAPHSAEATTVTPRVTPRWIGSVNVFSKTAVNARYWVAYAAQQNVPTNWDGNTSTCSAGSNNYASNAATLSALNFIRSVSGLAPVGQTGALNAKARATALMMAANKRVSHTPTSDWRCYTYTGASTARVSNILFTNTGLNSGRVIDLYMDDPGSANYAAGHRRWLLNPFTSYVGTANTSSSNAIQVVNVPTSYTRPNPAFVAWPNIGYSPNTLEPNGRWSLTGQKNMDFSRATVTVMTGGRYLPITKQPVRVGYGMPTIVWQMPATFNKSTVYRVTVRGIRLIGTTRTVSFSYPTYLFTPTH